MLLKGEVTDTLKGTAITHNLRISERTAFQAGCTKQEQLKETVINPLTLSMDPK